jgi:hypothetical protein
MSRRFVSVDETRGLKRTTQNGVHPRWGHRCATIDRHTRGDSSRALILSG